MLTYTYEVMSSNARLNTMEVKYSADGYDTITIGLPLPLTGEDPVNTIKMYAPIRQWLDSKKTVTEVAVGTTGVLTYDDAPITVPTTATTTSVANQQMWDSIAFEQSVAKVLVKFGVLASDPTAIQTTTL